VQGNGEASRHGGGGNESRRAGRSRCAYDFSFGLHVQHAVALFVST